MKILVVGNGAREDALSWRLARSPSCGELFAAPGNAGTATRGTNWPVAATDGKSLVARAVEAGVELAVLGPETAIAAGVGDRLRDAGIATFGPGRSAGRLESSKVFSKRFMERHGIPTAKARVVHSLTAAEKTLADWSGGCVVKADGLAAGKGVVICPSRRAAVEAAQGLLSGKLLGSAELQLVIEEFLVGEEVSFLYLSDGKHVTPLVPAQDHKRIGEGDTGPNTGGMGVYSTDEILEPAMQEWILHHIARPTIQGMADEGAPFVGVLYIGLMMTARGPQVLEFNARFGDPETQAILARLDSDLLEALEACVEGRLSETEFRWKPGASACVIASSGGYPGTFQTGFSITGLDEVAAMPGIEVFHSGTAISGGKLRTSGGRVLGVTATADSLPKALVLAYEAIAKLNFQDMYYRRDIGHRALHKPGTH